MQYRKDKYGRDLSILGYGCMRFTTAGGKKHLDPLACINNKAKTHESQL